MVRWPMLSSIRCLVRFRHGYRYVEMSRSTMRSVRVHSTIKHEKLNVCVGGLLNTLKSRLSDVEIQAASLPRFKLPQADQRGLQRETSEGSAIARDGDTVLFIGEESLAFTNALMTGNGVQVSLSANPISARLTLPDVSIRPVLFSMHIRILQNEQAPHASIRIDAKGSRRGRIRHTRWHPGGRFLSPSYRSTSKDAD